MSNTIPEEVKQIWEKFGGKDLFNLPLSEVNNHIKSLLVDKKQNICYPQTKLEGCMDEGVCGKSIGLGGPGIVLGYFSGKKQGKEGLEAVITGVDTVAEMLKGEVSTITSHSGCGACGIINNFLSDEEKKQFSQPDDLGVFFAKKVAEKMGINYKHVSWDDMARPSTGHVARIVLYTGSTHCCLDNCLEKGLAFTVSRGILEKLEDKNFASEIGKLLLETACKIATGSHGLGDLATSESPFTIIPVGGDKLSLEKLQQEAKEVADKFNGRVVALEGFSI